MKKFIKNNWFKLIIISFIIFYLFSTIRDSAIKKDCFEELAKERTFREYIFELESWPMRGIFLDRKEFLYQICIDVGGPKKIKKIDDKFK